MVDGDGRGSDRGGAQDRPAAGRGGAGRGDDGLAPVIPLFGAGAARRRGLQPDGGDDDAAVHEGGDRDRDDDIARDAGSARTAARPGTRTAVGSDEDGDPGGDVDGARAVSDGTDADERSRWHTTWLRSPARADHPSAGGGPPIRALPQPTDEDRHAKSRARFRDATAAVHEDAPDPDEVRDRAEAVLLRKLRTRSLSLSESRTALRGVEGVDDALVAELIDRFVDLGYLDDGALADQLALSGVERKGQGRRAVVQTMLKRGIPRDVADAAVDALPDDDDDRALEFARGKARAMTGQDYDTALRRLAGQLSRRGYPSSVSLNAARAALAEAGIGRARASARPATGVRFTPDED
ncbi:regulatory protein RecX [Microbacterium sp. HMH0099]|uniref:regulatory protein RecX n=1 Tax=Microbacterium sp. HMH0099 TaxID=3414026 RepID=UPI003BF659AB